MNASAECWEIHGEVAGYELTIPELGALHQLTVDAYGAQHARQPDRSIRLSFSLVGLHLALDLGASGREVRDAHVAMSRRQSSWPEFRRPSMDGLPTVLDVARAGPRANSPAGHRQAVQAWAAAVWAAWSGQHGLVAALAARTVPNRYLRPRGTPPRPD